MRQDTNDTTQNHDTHTAVIQYTKYTTVTIM